MSIQHDEFIFYKKKSVVVALLGARMHYAVPVAFSKFDLLHSFFTDCYTNPSFNFTKFLIYLNKLFPNFPISLLKSSFSRYEKSIPDHLVYAYNFWGLWMILCRNFLSQKKYIDILNLYIGKSFCKKIIRDIDWNNVSCIYAYKTAAKELFVEARKRNILCVVEQTIAPKQIEVDILSREFLNFSEWQDSNELGAHERMAEREMSEWSLSDVVVCASEFVADGLVECGVDKNKCHIIPYAINPEKYVYKERNYQSNRPIRILFAGEVGIRKGIHYLYHALFDLEKELFECKAVGNIALKSDAVTKLSSLINLEGQLPKNEMLKLYEWADVFVLPTLCEGSATVTYEAMACGLPVITTHNCGSVIEHDVNGFIIPVCDSKSLLNILRRIIENPSILNSYSKNLKNWSEGYSWSMYALRLSEMLNMRSNSVY